MVSEKRSDLLNHIRKPFTRYVAFVIGSLLGFRSNVNEKKGLPLSIGARYSYVVMQYFLLEKDIQEGVESVIPPDEVIDAMAHIGKIMHKDLKETGLGGLAATPTGKKLAAMVWEDSK